MIHSQVTELLLRNCTTVVYPEFFCAPCRKNYALDRKVIHLFNDLNVHYHHAKFGEDCTMHAGCRCENSVFVYFLSVALRSGRLCVRRGV